MKGLNLNKHRLWLLLMILILAILLGCSRLVYFGSSKKALTISTSFYPMYIMALNITKDVPGIKLLNLSASDVGCLHNIQLAPQDLKLLNQTNVFIVNGLGMEEYLDEVLENVPYLNVINASQYVNPSSVLASGHDHETQMQEYDQQSATKADHINPHIWVSISLAMQQVNSIAVQLAAYDPVNRDLYLKNAMVYTAELQELKNKMSQGLSEIEKRDIITFHEAFVYFAEEFDLNIAAVVQREPGSEPSAKELAETINQINNQQIKAIFVEPQYPDKAAQSIARETQAKVYTLDPIVSGPLDAGAYVKAMETNLKTLQEALRD